MSRVYTLGSVIRVTGVWTDAVNPQVAVDPEDAFCSITPPGQSTYTYTYGVDSQLKRASQGIYYTDIHANIVGVWSYTFWSTSTGSNVSEQSFEILAADDGSSSSSYAAVRECIIPQAATHDGCPILGKTPVVIVSAGECACIEWTVRNRQGQPANLNLISSAVVRFQDALGNNPAVYEIDATIVNRTDSLIWFQLTADLVANAGIWRMEIAWLDAHEGVIGTEAGYLSVERGLFGNLGNTGGPLTINEVRLQLRDTMIENSLLDDVEFDDVEIVHSILQPIREWNEKPPPVAFHTAASFPYHFHWLRAVVGNLLLTASHWYERNHLAGTHGGISVDDRAKANPYLAVAQLMRKEWLEFVLSKKVSINAALFMGHFGSPYG